MRLRRINRGDGRFCRQEAAAAGRGLNRKLNERQCHAPAAHCEGPMPFSKVTGDLPKIIANQERLYEGNLTFYFRILFFKSSNIYNPYRNFRHMLDVLWLSHQACRYYQNRLTPRQMRNLLIAALFHDFDHPGHPHPREGDPDRINIPIAIAGLRRYVMPPDRPFLPHIEALIEATHYPTKSAATSSTFWVRSAVTQVSLKRSTQPGFNTRHRVRARIGASGTPIPGPNHSDRPGLARYQGECS